MGGIEFPRQAGSSQHRPVSNAGDSTSSARSVAALRPGDIGFYYAPKKPGQHRTLKQWLISLGQGYAHLAHPHDVGDARFLHTYIVLQVFPGLSRIRVADAARDDRGRCGVGASNYDFIASSPHNPGGTHLFYRFRDPRLAQAVRVRAEAWAHHPSANFSNLRAAMAPFRNWSLFGGARRHIRHLLAHSPTLGPVPKLYGRGPYPLTCSNFISSVCVPEVIDLYCQDQRMPRRVTTSTLLALRHGSAGNIFACDPRWLLPSTLQSHFATSPAATPIGSICAEDGVRPPRATHVRGLSRLCPPSSRVRAMPQSPARFGA